VDGSAGDELVRLRERGTIAICLPGAVTCCAYGVRESHGRGGRPGPVGACASPAPKSPVQRRKRAIDAGSAGWVAPYAFRKSYSARYILLFLGC
jgi:hypothetical protein